jgi:hypothetical protein
MQYLKNFLTRVEQSSEHPNKELSIIGIYKKMYHLWEELEAYYRARLSEMEQTEQADELAADAELKAARAEAVAEAAVASG